VGVKQLLAVKEGLETEWSLSNTYNRIRTSGR
jgi:hypothetical protein